MPSRLSRLTGWLQKAAPGFVVPSGGGVVSLRDQIARLNQQNVKEQDGVSMGPGAIAESRPLDQSQEPRAFQYRVGWNIPSLPGEGRPVTLDTLRQLADTYDLLRKAIEIRKDELTACTFDLIARDPDRKKAREIVTAQQNKISEIRLFFDSPDKKNTWQSWIRMLLEEYFVVDAVAIYKRRTLGGGLHSLRLLDGSTIKPLLTVQGERPESPDFAYQQFLYGQPVYSFTTDELIYAVKNRRVRSPYGFSPVEQFIHHVTLCLRNSRYWLDYFTDGTLPEGVAEAPATWTPAQIEEFNAYWDKMLAGDSRALRKLHFVPAGFVFHDLKTASFDIEFARWLVGVTAAALDLTPGELGFEPQHGGLGGKGFAEEQSKVLQRKSTGPLIRWLCDEILNPIIWQEFGATDLQASLHLPGEEDEQLQKMQARDLAIRNGTLSIDQAVEEDGGEPPGVGRLFVTRTSVLFEPDLVLGSLKGQAALTAAQAQAMPQPDDEPDDGTSKQPGNQVDNQPDQPGKGAKPKAGQSSSKPAKASSAKPATEPDGVSKSLQLEYSRFTRHTKTRQQKGKWRDFESDVIPPAILADLNKAASASLPLDTLKAPASTDQLAD